MQRFKKTTLGFLVAAIAAGASSNSLAQTSPSTAANAPQASADQMFDVDLPAGSLTQAITALSLQSRVQILMDSDLVRNIEVPALKGRYTLEQALQRLLKGTALVPRRSGPTAFTLETVNEMPENVVMEEVVVIGTDGSRYQTSAGLSLTGLPLDYLELPRVVEVISEQLILDQKVTELEEVLRNVPGISLSDGFGGSNNDYLIRGFRRSAVYQDGIRSRPSLRVNTTNAESVKVIKGPASITYGQVEPGGLVDIVTKKPLSERRVYTEMRVGSFDNRHFLVDVSVPVNKSFAFRLNASTQDNDSFRDFFSIERDALALTTAYQWSDSTKLTASYEYRDEFRSFDRGTVTVPTPNGREIINRVFNIPIERRFGEPFEKIDTEYQYGTLGLEHDINSKWSMNLGLAFEKFKSDDLQARPRALIILDESAPVSNGFFTGVPQFESVVDEATDQVFLARRTDGSIDREVEALQFNARLNGELNLAGMRHRVAFGLDYQEQEGSRFFNATATSNGVPVALGGNGPLFDLKNPVYGNLPSTLSSEGRPLIEDENNDIGLYINDYIDLSERWGLLMGVRYDSIDVDGDGPAKSETELSPQLGLTYRLNNSMALFASYAEAFEPNTAFVISPDGSSSSTEVYDPEDSRQYELGFKAQWFEGRLNSTASIYSIEKNNVLTIVGDEVQLIKGQESQGFELSLSGQPTPGMNISAGYAYTDAEIKSGANVGKRPRNVAEHTFNVWSSYEFYQGSLQGLGAGIGAFYMGDRYGDNANSWNLGNYTTVDASVWYNLAVKSFSADGLLRFQLSAKNIFDKEYYAASGGDLRVTIGTPRSLFASVSATF
ncbi:TonB-dependent siderophore receptor [Pseudoteredinibacter isoporae]|uniref:Iron complex outermembrane receptor protein n=1 Tax=Pseudoteredinibacter isoporae TaxID=570281 RepID=A0A7X0MWS5_9GAMM|nr:TonB-dependent receptor [Pseudoteredinibacter isoporae]MBB6521269.1 iron complex outermembrane receptor protein [Pseudoteredinibacter isoporae]NHO86827.1 TonB-dependent receptor [Pseudoteredinibacter isoporae]NIB24721.1 TonB-dependent receptor [Pseudoteredinibacter isoporae]